MPSWSKFNLGSPAEAAPAKLWIRKSSGRFCSATSERALCFAASRGIPSRPPPPRLLQCWRCRVKGPPVGPCASGTRESQESKPRWPTSASSRFCGVRQLRRRPMPMALSGFSFRTSSPPSHRFASATPPPPGAPFSIRGPSRETSPPSAALGSAAAASAFLRMPARSPARFGSRSSNRSQRVPGFSSHPWGRHLGFIAHHSSACS